MAIKKMGLAQITRRKCRCWSLPYGMKKKIRGYETLTHVFTKKIWDIANNNVKKINRRTQSNAKNKKRIRIKTKTMVNYVIQRKNQNKEALLTKRIDIRPKMLDQRFRMKLSKPILKQIIMIPQLPLPPYQATTF